LSIGLTGARPVFDAGFVHVGGVEVGHLARFAARALVGAEVFDHLDDALVWSLRPARPSRSSCRGRPGSRSWREPVAVGPGEEVVAGDVGRHRPAWLREPLAAPLLRFAVQRCDGAPASVALQRARTMAVLIGVKRVFMKLPSRVVVSRDCSSLWPDLPRFMHLSSCFVISVIWRAP
jgi:hypothetical protein